MLICGIDEAGRGPVIGPMVFAAVVVDKKGEADLKRMGVTDSKLLDPATRKKLYGKIRKTAKEIKTTELDADQIDKWMNSANLNDVEAIETAAILDRLKSRPSVVYIDSPDTIPARYAKSIKNLSKCKSELVAEHHADSRYVVVGAASIIAKVIRDNTIEKLKAEYGEIGSGYPSDEVTQRWLDDYWEEHRSFPNIVRKKWATVQNKAQTKLSEYGGL